MDSPREPSWTRGNCHKMKLGIIRGYGNSTQLQVSWNCCVLARQFSKLDSTSCATLSSASSIHPWFIITEGGLREVNLRSGGHEGGACTCKSKEMMRGWSPKSKEPMIFTQIDMANCSFFNFLLRLEIVRFPPISPIFLKWENSFSLSLSVFFLRERLLVHKRCKKKKNGDEGRSTVLHVRIEFEICYSRVKKTMWLNVVFFLMQERNWSRLLLLHTFLEKTWRVYDNLSGYRKEYFAKRNFPHLFSLLSRSIIVSQINRDILPFRSVWTPTRTSRQLHTPQSEVRAMKKGPCRWIIETWGENQGAGFLKEGSRTYALPSFSDIYWTGRHAGSHVWELVEPCALLLLRARWKFSTNLISSSYLHLLLLHYFKETMDIDRMNLVMVERHCCRSHIHNRRMCWLSFRLVRTQTEVTPTIR